jgi:peptide/nickel transport system permease protein
VKAVRATTIVLKRNRLKDIAEDLRISWYRLKRSKLSTAGVVLIVATVLVTTFAAYLTPYPADAGPVAHFADRLQPPGSQHWLGTDGAGRDVLTRIVFGGRVALEAGLIIIAVAIGVGVPLGLIAGYLGGSIDTLIMRVTDVFLSIPGLALALIVAASVTPSLETSSLAISFVWWPWYVRLVRGEVLSLREEQFVEAARAVGASKMRVAFREILPNLIPVIAVKGSLDMGYAILWGVALNFLGLGVQEPTPDWGHMLAEGRVLLPQAWWVSTFPGIAILLTVLGFNLLGDGLRDIFDVRII